MKTLTAYFNPILCGLFFVLLTSSTAMMPNMEVAFKTLTYKIRPTSIMEVHGKTNVNAFCCTSKEQFAPKDLSFQLVPGTSRVKFQNTSLKIKIERLDCGSKLINRDLSKALLADQYPEIVIELKEVYSPTCQDLTECGVEEQFIANTDITITCETETIKVPVQVTKLDTRSFRITGGTQLHLCDFAINPPTAMMGLIKVKDTIEISFDLYVDLV